MKRRETVFADKTAMKASNTIYDIVSVTKGEVFPTEFFGDLVSVVIVSRAAHMAMGCMLRVGNAPIATVRIHDMCCVSRP